MSAPWAVGAIRFGVRPAVVKQQSSDIVQDVAVRSTTVTFASTVPVGSVVAFCYIRFRGNVTLSCSGLGATWANVDLATGTGVNDRSVGIWYGVTTSTGTTVTMTCTAGFDGMYTLSQAYTFSGGTPGTVGTAQQIATPTAVATTPAVTCNTGDVVLMAGLLRGNNALDGASPVVYSDSPAAWTALLAFSRLSSDYDGSFSSYLVTAERSVAADGESVSRQTTVTSSASDATCMVAAIRIVA